MNSVNRFRPAVQFRCCPLVGKSSFGYEQRLRVPGGVDNYQNHAALVGQIERAFADMNAEGLKAWKSLTGTTSTGEAEQSASLVMTEKNSGSYSESQATSTTACCPSSNSRRNTSEWMNEH